MTTLEASLWLGCTDGSAWSVRVLVTGAAGNLGRKAIDADLTTYDQSWSDQFGDVDVVVHLAAEPRPVNPYGVSKLATERDGAAVSARCGMSSRFGARW